MLINVINARSWAQAQRAERSAAGAGSGRGARELAARTVAQHRQQVAAADEAVSVHIIDIENEAYPVLRRGALAAPQGRGGQEGEAVFAPDVSSADCEMTGAASSSSCGSSGQHVPKRLRCMPGLLRGRAGMCIGE